MDIITSPWIAVDLGTDRAHAALLDANGEARSIIPPNGEFDAVFHVSRHGDEIRVGQSAVEHAAEDPGGFISLSTFPLKENATIHFPDGRGPTNPLILYTALLTRVREYCSQFWDASYPLRTCVLTFSHRGSTLRRRFAKIASEAGFTEVHFRDSVVAAATVWKNVWGEKSDFVTVCNMGAAQLSLTLMKCKNGGCERVEEMHSVVGVGVDEIDRVILSTADKEIPLDSPNAFSVLRQLKMLRKSCSFTNPDEHFRFYLSGRKKKVRTVHFEVGTRIYLQRVLACFQAYNDRTLVHAGRSDIPVVLVGGGAYNPLIFQEVEKFFPKVYWWAEAEEAVVIGAAMMFMPKRKPSETTAEEEQFYQCYENADAGDPESQYHLAKRLESGEGTPISQEEAVDWFCVSARSGFIKAKFELAKCLFQGLGVPSDPNTAVRILEATAAEGYAPSQYSMAVYLYNNKPEAKAEADDWLHQAVEQGYPEALTLRDKRIMSGNNDMPSPGDWNLPAEVVFDSR